MTLRWAATSQQETSDEAWHVPVILRQAAGAVVEDANHVMQGTGQPMANWAAPSRHVVLVLHSISILVAV